MNNERRKIEFVTKATGGFRGIPMMLFGIAMIISMILNYIAELDSQRKNYAGKDLTISLSFILICLIIFVIGYPKLRAYFRKKFGQTKAKPKTFQTVLECFLYSTPILANGLFNDSIDAARRLPFSLTVLSVAVFTFFLWWFNYRGVTNSILYLSALIFAASFLDWEKVFLSVTILEDYYARTAFYRSVCSLLLGIIYFVMGLVDYQILTKTLKPITREEEVYESV